MCARGETGLGGGLGAWSRRNAELGKRAGKVATRPEPSEDRQRAPGLAWWRVDDRPAGRTGVEVLADLPELFARQGELAVHGVGDRVPRAEGGRRRRGAQLGGYGGVRAEHHREQPGLQGEGGEHAGLSRLAVAGDDDRVGKAGAGDARLGWSFGQ